ncbi:hypothetical protein FFWV33_04670 [Flavobacterium faecale]|uniref:Outer membrane protein beta-barrel domain-containing protein n=1 Tax=Flavobacterium faecale TaxID=1355330 RepID=A0A2S1LBF1_9FLAO|nr:hypothetical protein [Flavobacterium faecale]AWG20886.1 hypothetical protein FFWV33_04670 [Flavobacterium faecale]
MKEKKNIDRLFQEQLKDFEAMPDGPVWQNIAAALEDDKKKRRIIPLWWWYSGVAVAVILGLFVIKISNDDAMAIPKTVVLQKHIPLEKDSISKKKMQTVQENIASSFSNNKKKNTEQSSINASEVVSSSNKKKENTQQTSNNVSEAISLSNTKKKHVPQPAVQENLVLSFSNNKKKSTQQTTASTPEAISFSNKKKEMIVDALDSKVNTNKTSQVVTTNNQVASLPDNNNTNKWNNTAAQIKKQSTENQKTAVGTNLKTTQIAEKEPNLLDAILEQKNKKNKAIVDANKGKWKIVPTVAPVYLQTSTGGSPIDKQLSENDKTANTNLSFGLGVRYAVTPKLSIRSGINKLALDYSTSGIRYSPNVVSSGLSSVVFKSDTAFEVQSAANDTQNNANTVTQKSIEGSINQKMGYFELPMEVSYALLNKKFGLSLIGGFSTLFLSENKILLQSNATNAIQGEANNLNKIHLSSNFGVGFKYQIVPSLQFHFEPMVKYQWNTFSSNSNDFKPVFLGLYSGVSYQF